MTVCASEWAPMEAHQALFYRDADEYLAGISAFVDPALERDEAVAVAVPAPKLELLRGDLGRRASRVQLLDMYELGANPARIIPATNTVRHTDSQGFLRFWRTPAEVIFQVEDSGHIADPLAGRRRQAPGTGGLGLWMVNHLCDLVEVRTSAAGTTIRVHSRLARPPRHEHGDRRADLAA